MNMTEVLPSNTIIPLVEKSVKFKIIIVIQKIYRISFSHQPQHARHLFRDSEIF